MTEPAVACLLVNHLYKVCVSRDGGDSRLSPEKCTSCENGLSVGTIGSAIATWNSPFEISFDQTAILSEALESSSSG